jgi:PAS domain S-box-containing protein
MTPEDRAGGSPQDRPASAGPQFRLRPGLLNVLPAPLWVLVLVLLLTTAATATVRGFVQQQQQTRFGREVAAYQRELRQRFLGYESVLQAVRASWEGVDATASDPPNTPVLVPPALSSQQFGRLVAGLDLGNRFPGIMSLGYAPLISAAQRDAYARQLPLLAGDPAARLHPSSNLGLSAPVTYLASVAGVPTAGDRSVLGYDMYSDPVRQAGIRQAVQSGTVRATGLVQLLSVPTDAPDRSGLILYLPLRHQGQVSGVVFAPLQIAAVLPPAMGQGNNRLGLKIVLNGQQLNLPGTELPGTELPGTVLSGSQAGFHQIDQLTVAGQSWNLEFMAAPGFGQDAAAQVPWLVLGAGVLVSLLAALATQAQVRARERAEQVSRSLRLSQSRLERSRAEFEAVFRAMQDTAIFTDSSGQVQFANDALKGSFGLSPFELRGTPIADLHADARLLARLDALPGPQLVTTLFRRRQEGPGASTFYGELQRSRVLGESGETLGQLEVIRDVSERLQAERALREGERRYQGVLESMPQLVFLADGAGRVGYLNRRWWEYVGGSQNGFESPLAPSAAANHGNGDWSGILLSALHPDDRRDFLRQWQASLASGRELETEHRLRAASGQYRTFVTRARPIYSSPGQVQEWVGSSTDIDDQIYSELNSRLLADVGQALSTRQNSEPGLQGVRETGVSPGADVSGTAQKGPTPERADAKPMYTGPIDARPVDTGPTDSSLGQALDLMTARFADSAALWLSREYLHEHAGAPHAHEIGVSQLLVAGRARRYLRSAEAASGRAAALTLGWLEGEVGAAMSSREVATFQDQRLHALSLSSAALYPLLQGETVLGVLGLGFRGALQDRDLDLGRELAQRLASALDNRQLLARLRSARASLQDLNDSLEQRVGERTLQLSEANRELEAFSYSVSHDLRTPLRHILGFADLLRREQTSSAEVGAAAPASAGPKANRYLNIITESAERMNKLIDDLLEFSRTSRAELRRVPVDLRVVVQDSVRGLAPDQGQRQVQWSVGPLPTVIGDAGLLRQVFDNLLSNALKYTRTRDVASIEIEAILHGREVWLSVRDNGVGFDPEYAAKLFGVFQRLHRSEDFEGTGIGLANVRRIVSRHGGRVWAESGQSQPGAVFWLALPVEALSLEKRGQRAATETAAAPQQAVPSAELPTDQAPDLASGKVQS